MCAWMIDQYGNEEVKKRWLPELVNLVHADTEKRGIISQD